MPERNDENRSQRSTLVALAVVVLLFAIGWWLAHALYKGGQLEDCLMSGRTNCAPIEQGR